MENLNDPWSTQKAKSVHFYKEVFNKDISFEGVKIPEYTKEFSVLGYIDRSITGRTMLQVYREFLILVLVVQCIIMIFLKMNFYKS